MDKDFMVQNTGYLSHLALVENILNAIIGLSLWTLLVHDA
jgi:hypothetical protein